MTQYRQWTILRKDDVLVFTSAMAIDADGSPRAYHPDDVSGLDDLSNAGSPEHWWALATVNGDPLIQGKGDTAPSFYVSATSLEDHSFPATSPAHFVDAENIPYIALPKDLPGPELGDVAYVFNAANGRSSAAIFADESPRPGEGSIALARALGINADARRGGTSEGITFVVFLNSGDHTPSPREELNARVRQLSSDLDVAGLLNCLIEPRERRDESEAEQGQTQ